MKKATTMSEVYQVFAQEHYLSDKDKDKDFYVEIYKDDLKRFSNDLIDVTSHL